MWQEKEKKKWDERKLPWGAQEMRETDIQEAKRSDHDERMDDRGLGMACENNREGGEDVENICSVYLLRSRMHDHNPPCSPEGVLGLDLSFSLSPGFLLYLSVFPFLSLCPSSSSLCHFTTC